MKKKTDIPEEPVDQHIEEWKDKYLRALADYQNLERRVRDEKNEIRQFASEMIIMRLLPVVDTFQRAKDHIQDTGFDLALKELMAVLEEQGVEKIEVRDKPFNPHEMECIEVTEGKEGMVVEELLPGYRFREKVIRVAQVKVGKHTESVHDKFTNKQIHDSMNE